MSHARPKISDRGSTRDFINLAGDFKILADPTRLKIVAHLAREGEINVTGICKHVGQSQPAVSHHLALMRVSGFVEARRDGKANFYNVVTERFAALWDFLPAVLETADVPAKDGARLRRVAKQALREPVRERAGKTPRARRATLAPKPPTTERVSGDDEGAGVGAGERADEVSVVVPTVNGDVAAVNGDVGVEDAVLAAG